MERTPETIEIMVEKLFKDSVFDPQYMDEDFTKSQFRTALSSIPEEDWDWIVRRILDDKRAGIQDC